MERYLLIQTCFLYKISMCDQCKTNQIYVKFDCGQNNLLIAPNSYVFITAENSDNSFSEF